MRTSTIFSALALLVGSVAAHNTTSLTGFLQQLQSLGLTSFVNASSAINSTSTGQSLLSILGTEPQTVFAPNNDAWAGAYPNITNNTDLLAAVLSYHIVPGTFNTTPTYPNTTVGRTLLNDSDLVFLEGNKRQVIAWSDRNGTVDILNQNTPCVVVNSTTLGNVTLHVTSAVIDVPGELEAALFANNLTSFTSALQQASLLDTVNREHGVTIFAPTDAAFSAVQQNLTAAGSNSTALANILRNHVINGTSVYTGNLIGLGRGSNVTTAAGEGLSSTFNSTGGYVTVGNTTAEITTPDVVLWNGVMHIVDAVFLDESSNESAASSALSSASAAATSSASESGPIGFTPSPTSTGGGSALANTASSAAMSAMDIPFARVSIMGATTVLGAILGAMFAL